MAKREVSRTDSEQETDKRILSRRSLIWSGVALGAAVPAGLAVASLQTRNAVVGTRLANQSAAVIVPEAPQKALGSAGQAFSEILSDEQQHVTFLANALGGNARPEPAFKGLEQADPTSFATLSRVFENTGVGAYLMAAPAITSKAYLAAAGSILTIEARHAGFLDYFTGQALSPNGAFDKPITQADIVNAVSPFISSLNGGPDPAGKLGSDADILNFALLLEYLERDFYQINVPKFYGVNGNG